ncbi:MAG: HAD family hydrolase, partial [Fibrobacterota bacterium]
GADGPTGLLGRRRMRESDPWSGHLALPGGRPEEQDRDLMDTALRECREESGIVRTRCDVVGGLQDIVAGRVTGRHIRVSPFLLLVDDFCQTENGDGEIEEWMPFPLRWLDDPSLRTNLQASDGSIQDALKTPLGILWGMTLKLLERTWRAPLVHGVTRLWLDFDGTVYPASHELADEIDRRITAWVAKARSIAWEDADILRRDLYRKHGNTLRGMMREDDIDPNAYLDFVFDLPDSVFPSSDEALASALRRIGLPISVFTNAREDYVRRGWDRLGLPGIGGPVHDIASFGWTAKPEPRVYDEVLRREAVTDPGTVLFAEDRAENLAPARARGMRCVWIDEDASGDWTDSVNGRWDTAPWHWKLRTLTDLPVLLLPRLGTESPG